MKNSLLRMAAICAMLTIAQIAFAQKITVTGQVLDASDGQPLIGAGVVPSTGGGTITDYEGMSSVLTGPHPSLSARSVI